MVQTVQQTESSVELGLTIGDVEKIRRVLRRMPWAARCRELDPASELRCLIDAADTVELQRLTGQGID